MAQINGITNSFLGGEISPRAQGRTELDTYPHSGNLVQNLIVQPQGGISRRMGTRFVRNTTGNNKARMLPFIVSDAESFAIEATDGDFGAINTDTLLDITVSILAANIFGDHAFSTSQLDQVQFASSVDLLFMAHPDEFPLVMAFNKDAGTMSVDAYQGTVATFSTAPNPYQTVPFTATAADSGVTFTPSVTTGSGTLSTSSPYFTAGHVGSFFQFENGVAVVTAFTSNVLVDITVQDDFDSTSAIDKDSVQESAWSNFFGFPRAVALFQNRLYWAGTVNQPDTIFASETGNFFVMSLAVGESLTDDSPFAFTISSARFNPIQWMAVGRNLTIGTLGDEYIATQLSATAAVNIEKFTSHGSAFVQAQQVGPALHFVDKSRRFIREFIFDFDSDSFKAINMSLLAEHLFDKRARAEQASGAARTVSSGIKQTFFQETPYGIIWCVDFAGALFGATRERNQNIVAWHTHILGGSSSGVDKDPIVESGIAIPDSDGNIDQLWFSVERFINGSTVRFIEFIGPEFRSDEVTAFDSTAVYTDASVVSITEASPFAPPTTTFRGFNHLIGETVQITADLFFVGEKVVTAAALTGTVSVTATMTALVGVGTLFDTELVVDETILIEGEEFTVVSIADDLNAVVSVAAVTHAAVVYSLSGRIELGTAATRITAGLKYVSRFEGLEFRDGSAIGTAIGLVKRIDRTVTRFYDTIGAKIGSKDSDLEELIFRPALLPMQDPIPTFTGSKLTLFPNGYETSGIIVIQQDEPLPMNIASIVYRAEVNEG